MKIRHKITCWITGAGLLVSIVFSLVIFFEMKELPFDVVDAELRAMGKAIAATLAESEGLPWSTPGGPVPFAEKQYWISLYDIDGEVVYESPWTRVVHLPEGAAGTAYTVRRTIPKTLADFHQDKHDEVTFRVCVLGFSRDGERYRLQIAKPVENLDEELWGLVNSIAVGMAAAMLVLVALSTYLAGRIVRPIAAINRLSREITEKTLDRRIPLGSSRDELYTLSESLNRMFDRLQFSFGQQKRFIADAAHELKNPLTLVLLFLGDLLHRGDLPDDVRDGLRHQTETLRRMSRLIKNLLELSAMELAQKLTVEELDLSELIRSVVDDYRDFLEARDIRVQFSLPEVLRLRADPEKLRRVLINLVDNAIKYNQPTAGEIRIHAEDQRKQVAVAIGNRGPGIPQSEQAKVFEQFYRVEKSRSLQYGGAGLGLTIVRKIVQLHGGSIGIESEPGAWTRVWFTLPIRHKGAN